MGFKNNVKFSFMKTKEKISELELRIEELEEKIRQIYDMQDLGFHRKDTLPSKVPIDTPKKFEFTESEASSSKSDEISIGNQGVHATLQQRCNGNATVKQDQFNGEKLQNKGVAGEDLANTILSLTDAEFRIFMAIYRTEKELKRSVTYTDLSKELNMTQGGIRGYIRNLLVKRLPLIKYTSPNGKVYLSIDENFKTLKIFEILLSLRYKNSVNQPL